MFYLDHCKTAIREQVQVLTDYQSEIDEPDYEFIRNHALSIYQISDHIVCVSGGAEVPQDPGSRIDSSELLTKDQCRKALNEQIQMLAQYLGRDDESDYAFVRIHAMYIMQLTDHLRRSSSGPLQPGPSLGRVPKCEPTV